MTADAFTRVAILFLLLLFAFQTKKRKKIGESFLCERAREKGKMPAAELTLGLLEDYAVLIATAVATIVVGARRSAKDKEDKDEDDDDEETISTKDAWQFPLYASCALLGLYALVRLVRADLLGLLIALYFSVLGALCVARVFRPLFARVFPAFPARLRVPVPRWAFADGPTVLGAALLGAPAALAWAATRHWAATDALAVCFGVEAIALLRLGSFAAGAALLGGLFVYDVFWVFGTHVMVAVVRGFDAPIKIAYPRSGVVAALLQGAPIASETSLLGLGDIAIPGIFLALLLRVGKPYFRAGLAAYALSLVATMAVVHVFGAAQPALLYIVPALLGSSLLVAFFRGEVGKLVSFKLPSKDEQKKDQ